MMTAKQEALARFRIAFKAYEDGLNSAKEMAQVEREVLDVEGVKPQNIRDIKSEVRGSIVRNR